MMQIAFAATRAAAAY